MPSLRAGYEALRARLRDRPDSEHEQAIVRPIVASLLFIYLVPETLIDRHRLIQSDYVLIGAIATFLAISLGIFISVLASKRASPVRRLFSVTVDLAAVTYFMSQTDMRGLPLSLAYVWISLANGFRFGPQYLLYSLVASVVGFSIVIWLNPFFNAHVPLGLGLILGMIALDLYVLSLVKSMFRALARAEAANQAKRRFISVVSHEMRTPLNAIIGMADLLGTTGLVAAQADMVRTLTTASRALLRLVEEVLDFSKIEAGRLTLERIDFDLHALVNGTVRILRPQAEAKGLALTVSIMPEVPHALRGDPHYLRQVLINLVSNAVKFTAEGSVVVHLSQIAEDESTARIKFSVRDTGIGIPPEVQERIFESFVQADQSTARKYGGTGLGTAIAKQLVELMGGRMGLESAVGLGSTFWFELPLGKQAAAAEAAETFDSSLAGAPVLMVAFPGAEADATAQLLRGWGADPVVAPTIEIATQRLAVAEEQAVPIHSVLVFAERIDAARQILTSVRRGSAELPPLLLCLSPASGRQVPVPAELAASFTAVLYMPLQSRLLFNALHAVSALEERDVSPGVVRLRDYLQKRGPEARYRIIVADDSATNRHVVGQILERGGHDVTLVEDGEDVLDAIENESFDLVVLDRNMPGMDGVATVRALRAIGVGDRRVPVVILSADVTQEARDECAAAGADLFLPKPIEAMRLLEQVAELCQSAPQRRPVDQSAPIAAAPPARVAANPETLRLLDELGSQPGFVERLIATFVKDHAELMGRMERAVDAADFAELRRLFHAMKGSAASLGAERLVDVCARGQKMTDSEMARKPDLVSSIRGEFEQARAAFDRYIEERRRTTG